MNKCLKTAPLIRRIALALRSLSGQLRGSSGGKVNRVGYYGYGSGMMGGGYGSMFFMPILVLLLFGFIIWAFTGGRRNG